MTDSVLARLAKLKTTPTAELRTRWRELFDSEPPRFNRRFLESRLAYRIQELEHFLIGLNRGGFPTGA